MNKSSKSTPPRKPYPDFPLFPHATRRWAKKIRGKLCYFGPWHDPDAALTRYLDQKDDLHAGRTPRAQRDGLTIRELANEFLTSKKMMMDAGELTARSWRDYHVTCERLVEFFGKTRLVIDLDAGDFDRLKSSLAKTSSPITVGNEVNRVRVVFNWAFAQGRIDRPLRFGPAFKKPSKKTIRLERAKKGPRMFEADQLRRILDVAPMPMKAMVLLGINAGLGNTDLANLQLGNLGLDGAWLNYPRPKTGIGRRCPLPVQRDTWRHCPHQQAPCGSQNASGAGRKTPAATSIAGHCRLSTSRRCVTIIDPLLYRVRRFRVPRVEFAGEEESCTPPTVSSGRYSPRRQTDRSMFRKNGSRNIWWGGKVLPVCSSRLSGNRILSTVAEINWTSIFSGRQISAQANWSGATF